MATTDLGDIIGGIGDVKPETIKLLHDRERMGLEASRQRALDDYYKSIIGQTGARIALEGQRVGLEQQRLDQLNKPKPHFTRGGQVIITDPKDPTGYRAVSPTGLLSPAPKVIPYNAPGGAREKGLAAASGILAGPWTEQEKLQRLMEAGLSGPDAKTYLDIHKDATSLAKRAEVEYQKKAAGKPHDESIITAYNDFLRAGAGSRAAGGIEGKYEVRDMAAAIAAAVAAAVEKSRVGEGSFEQWEPQEREAAFLDKYYTGRDPRFAWGDRRSYSDFQRGYYGWLSQTNRSPLTAITARSDIRSLQGALNDITKREGLINSFVDRIEANAKVVRDLQAKYKINTKGRLMNEAQNLVTRGIMGSGDLESLRLALFSLSQEVTKVETGQLGIAAPSVTQSTELLKIHDINLNIEDLDKVIQTSTRLGQTSRDAMRTTREDLVRRISTGGGPSTVLSVGDDVKKKIIASPKFKDLKDGEPITYNGQQIGVKKGNSIVPSIVSPGVQ